MSVIQLNRLKPVRMSTYNYVYTVIDKIMTGIYLIVRRFIVTLNTPVARSDYYLTSGLS